MSPATRDLIRDYPPAPAASEEDTRTMTDETPTITSLIEALRLQDAAILDADAVLRAARDSERQINEALHLAGYNVPQRNEVHAVLTKVIDALRAVRDNGWAERDVITERLQGLIDVHGLSPITPAQRAVVRPMIVVGPGEEEEAAEAYGTMALDQPAVPAETAYQRGVRQGRWARKNMPEALDRRGAEPLIADVVNESPEWVTGYMEGAAPLLDEPKGPEPQHTVGGQTSTEGWPYGTKHDMTCPACVADGSSFTASPRSETYWSS